MSIIIILYNKEKMSTDTYKYWATNRGWISTKFAVRNPVSHFLNVYKKKNHQNNPSIKNN